MMLLWKLFISFIQIGAFSFGGGYAAFAIDTTSSSRAS